MTEQVIIKNHEHSSLQEFDTDKRIFEQDFRTEKFLNNKKEHVFVPCGCIKIHTMKQLKKLFDDIYLLEQEGRNFFYRGHADADWLLESTLEREIKNDGVNLDGLIVFAFKKFKEKLRGNLIDQSLLNIRHVDDARELWAIGRHFGLKTPYLDWTKSVYVALFMAYAEHIDNNCKYAAIFMADKKHFPDCHGLVSEYWFTPKTDYYGRITAQKGYLSGFKIRNYLKQELRNHPNSILKIYISRTLKKEILSYLNHIGIEYTTMYPDLAGVVMSVNNDIVEIIQRAADHGTR